MGVISYSGRLDDFIQHIIGKKNSILKTKGGEGLFPHAAF